MLNRKHICGAGERCCSWRLHKSLPNICGISWDSNGNHRVTYWVRWCEYSFLSVRFPSLNILDNASDICFSGYYELIFMKSNKTFSLLSGCFSWAASLAANVFHVWNICFILQPQRSFRCQFTVERHFEKCESFCFNDILYLWFSFLWRKWGAIKIRVILSSYNIKFQMENV